MAAQPELLQSMHYVEYVMRASRTRIMSLPRNVGTKNVKHVAYFPYERLWPVTVRVCVCVCDSDSDYIHRNIVKLPS